MRRSKKNLIHTDGNDKNLVLVHIRSINEKSYKVTEIKKGDDAPPEIQVETDMAEDEVKKFEEDWTSLWNPDITQNDIEKLHQ